MNKQVFCYSKGIRCKCYWKIFTFLLSKLDDILPFPVKWPYHKDICKDKLTHFLLMPHIWVNESGQHWFRSWLGALLAPSHYLNQCWLIVNWTHRNKFKRNLNPNSHIFIQENTFENVVCQNGGHLVQGRWVNCLAPVEDLWCNESWHDDVIKGKHFPSNWPFVQGIHRCPVNSPHKGQWRRAFDVFFDLRLNIRVNNREAGDWRCHYAHYDVTVM